MVAAAASGTHQRHGLVASAGFAASAGLLVVFQILHRKVRVELGTEADVTTGVQLPDLAITSEPQPDDGPVLIQIEYQIAPSNRKAFIRAIHAIAPTRRRNGATSWRVFRDRMKP